MALKKPTTTKPATTAAFEEDPADTAVIEQDGGEDTGSDTTQAEAPAAQPEAKAEATSRAVAPKASTNVAVSSDIVAKAKSFRKEIESMQGAADFSYGANRVFKAKDGEISEMSGEKFSLGRWAKVRLLAWDRHFEISPGEESASSSAFVAYSADGKTIDFVVGDEQKGYEGSSVDDYLKYLRETEDFDNATVREFIDTQVAVLGCENEPEFMEVVQVTLASSSIPAFKKYQSQLEAKAKCVEMGLAGFSLPEDPFTFYFVREQASKGKNSWTKLKIETSLPTKI